MRTTRLVVLGGILPLLTGCAATMMAGGIMENEIQVTIDNNQLPASVKATLLDARTLGVISSDPSSIKAADLFETRGGYIVKIERVAGRVGEMTGSERRDALLSLCKNQRPDVAMLARIARTEGGSVLGTAFTGRVKMNEKWVMEILNCRSSIFDSFGGMLNTNFGVYNANNQNQMAEAIGAALGGTLLDALDGGVKGKPTRVTADFEPKANVSASGSLTSSSTSAATVASERKSMSTKEAQTRLASLGYNVGTPDGVSGKRTVDAIKKFQLENQLPSSGKIDEATTVKLIQRTSSLVIK